MSYLNQKTIATAFALSLMLSLKPVHADCPKKITITNYGLAEEYRFSGGDRIELWGDGSMIGTLSVSEVSSGQAAGPVPGMEPPAKHALEQWAKCLSSGRGAIASRKGNSGSPNIGSSSAQAEQFPNCPPTLPPSCVTWSQYDRQLQWWNLTNNCGRDVTVTFRSEGGLEHTQTFGNGESYRAKWRGENPPKQVVWDAVRGNGFYRNKPVGAALKCRESLPL